MREIRLTLRPEAADIGHSSVTFRLSGYDHSAQDG